MKKHKVCSILYYITAVLFDLSAIVTFVGGNNNSMGVVWLCLGSTFLCLGSVYLNRSKENKDNKDNKDK